MVFCSGSTSDQLTCRVVLNTQQLSNGGKDQNLSIEKLYIPPFSKTVIVIGNKVQNII